MKRLLLTIVLFALMLNNSQSQSLPDAMRITPDGRMIITGDQANTGWYNQALIRDVYIDFPQSNYWTLLTNNYQSHTNIPATMTVGTDVFDSVGVRFKGQTSYSMLGSSQKKSFNIETNFYKSGQEVMGYNIFNFNNAFQDPSFLREVFYQNQIKRHVPAAKSNYIHLYLNNQDWGLYPNVQQLNGDYLKEWFMSNDGTNWRADRPNGVGGGGGGGWGDGTAALNYLGADSTDYNTYYTLKSTTKTDPWSDLINTCDVLENQTGAALDSLLPNVLDIDRTLWFLASEIAFTDDDSYVYKGKMDYYTYWEIETGRMTPLEYDGNSAMETNFATSWGVFYHQTNANYPLLNKMLARPQWRQRYLAHMRTIIAEELDSTSTSQILTNFVTAIDALVLSDPKKIYTYANFTSEVTVLRNFMNTRRNYLNSNTEIQEVAPSISNVSYSTSGTQWQPPQSMQGVDVVADVVSTNGIYEVNLYYATGIVGNFTKTLMYDDGLHNDNAAGDGTYGASIPGYLGNTRIRYYIEAAANNTAHSVSYEPVGAEHDVYTYFVNPLISSFTDVVVNEIMASNTTTASDSAGDYDDWIELYNNSSNAVDISGYFVTDDRYNLDKFQIPQGTVMAGNSYLILWADEDGGQGSLHCNFKFSASGEEVLLLDSSLALINDVPFGQQTTDMGYARVPNGTGGFVIQIPTFSFNNNSQVGIQPLVSEGMSVYPNPANSDLHIITNNIVKEIVITDALGRELYKDGGTNSFHISTNQWSNGMYFVKTESSVSKVMVQH